MAARLTSFSRAEACAHLLRHLNDASAVRTNPLVEHLFPEGLLDGGRLLSAERESLARVRQLVRAAADALRDRDQRDAAAVHAHRQYAILVRCDLEKERHQAVADDLGLSLSQFYRERRAARDWVAQYIDRYADRVKPQRVQMVLDPLAFDIELARTLCSAGDYDRAVKLLEGLTDRLEQPAQRLEVYCLLVKFLSEARRYGEIHLALQAARECFANLRLSNSADLEEQHGKLEVAASEYHWVNGDSHAALESLERATVAFSGNRFRPGGDGEENLAGTLLDLAHGYISVGRFREAEGTIGRARTVIDDLAMPNPRLRAGFLVVLGFLQTNSLNTMNQAIATLHSASEIAHTHRLAKEAILALAGLSMHAQFHGDFVAATEYITECIALGERVLTPYDHSNLLLRRCELDAISGRPLDALMLATQLREHYPAESGGWIKATLFSSMASLSAGDYLAALRTSQVASEVAARKNDFRLHGAALQVQAAAGARLGLEDAARASIERAIDVLEAHGSPYILLLGYEESSRITGNHRHATSARELRSTVFRSSPIPALAHA